MTIQKFKIGTALIRRNLTEQAIFCEIEDYDENRVNPYLVRSFYNIKGRSSKGGILCFSEVEIEKMANEYDLGITAHIREY